MARICVIEDDPDQAFLLKRLLEKDGHIVNVIDATESIIEILIDASPDLILMDVALPIIDGISLSRKIREHSQFALVPIVALTALSPNEIRRSASHAGINSVVSKPITGAELRKTIEEELGQQP